MTIILRTTGAALAFLTVGLATMSCTISVRRAGSSGDPPSPPTQNPYVISSPLRAPPTPFVVTSPPPVAVPQSPPPPPAPTVSERAAAAAKQYRNGELYEQFAPVRAECESQWSSQSTKCAELPGLSDDDRTTCQKACAFAGTRGYQDALQKVRSDCSFASTPPRCNLAKPTGASVDDVTFKGDLATCTQGCRDDRKAAAEAARQQALQAAQERAHPQASSAADPCKRIVSVQGPSGTHPYSCGEIFRKCFADTNGNVAATTACARADGGYSCNACLRSLAQ